LLFSRFSCPCSCTAENCIGYSRPAGLLLALVFSRKNRTMFVCFLLLVAERNGFMAARVQKRTYTPQRANDHVHIAFMMLMFTFNGCWQRSAGPSLPYAGTGPRTPCEQPARLLQVLYTLARHATLPASMMTPSTGAAAAAAAAVNGPEQKPRPSDHTLQQRPAAQQPCRCAAAAAPQHTRTGNPTRVGAPVGSTHT
jgi:hypothetical protein